MTMELKLPVVTLIILSCNIPEITALSCYECSDTFKRQWEPRDCQTNVTSVPIRTCNAEQPYCLVKSVTVKSIVTEITRDCAEGCRYGCEATSFGITRMTCVSCCDTDNCNTGSAGYPSAPVNVHLHRLVVLCVIVSILSAHMSIFDKYLHFLFCSF